ncbi:MAG: hypothetical protein V7740_18525 [Pseudomonas marincola]
MSSKREAEKDFLYQKYFTTMIFMVIGAIMVFWSDDEGIPYALFLMDTGTGSGTVTEFHGIGHDRILSFSFTDQNGNVYSKTKLIHAGTPFVVGVGDTIGVTFFPRYPEIFEATSLISVMETGFWIMIIGIAFVLLGAVFSVFSILQLLKHNKEDLFY